MFKLAGKDLKLFFADKKSMLLTFLLPIALITLFAFAFGGVGRGDEKPQPKEIIIGDNDQSPFSKMIIARLDSLEEFTVTLTTADTADMLIKKGDESAALIILKGAGDSLRAGKLYGFEYRYDQARGPEVAILQGALIGNLMRILQPDTIKPEERKSFISSVPLVAEKENSPGLIHAVAGTAIMMLLFSVAGIGASLLDEKAEGTLKKLLYSPLPPNSILFGKMIFTNIISIFQLTVMFLFAWIVFGLDILPHLPSLVLMIVVTAWACSSFGVLLAAMAKSRSQVQGLSTLIILVMSCIGGSMVPSFIMPEVMQKAGVLSVNYWGIQGFYDIFWRGLAINDTTFLQRVLVLILIGAVFNFLATRLFKRNILSVN